MNFDEKCNIYEHFDVQLQTFTCVCGMKFNKNEVKLIKKYIYIFKQLLFCLKAMDLTSFYSLGPTKPSGICTF